MHIPVLRSRVRYEVTHNNATLEDLVIMFPKNTEEDISLAMLLVDDDIFTTYPEDGESV